MDGDTAAALRQVRLALRRLLGPRLQLAADEPSPKTPREQASTDKTDYGGESTRSEAKASSG